MAAERRAAEQATLRAAKEAERQRKEAERRDRESYLMDRAGQASAQTAAVEQQMRELGGILPTALLTPVGPVDFNRLKRPTPTIPFNPGAEAHPVPPPDWAAFAPVPPGRFGRMLGGAERHAQAEQAARSAFEAALDNHRAAETARAQRVAAARREHAERQAKATADAAAQHAKVDQFAQAVLHGDRHAVSRYYQQILEQLPTLAGFPQRLRAGYVPESTLLAIEWQLPNTDIVPAHRAFRYVKTRDAIEATARPVAEIRQAYQRMVAQLALRSLRAVFGADPAGLVSTIVFNGIVHAVEPSTGQSITPCLITLRATRDQFTPLVLEKLDPVACVRKYFAADVSAHPDELQAVQPVMEFEMADPRIIDPVDVISGLDRRPNLLELSAKLFEDFVQNLFAKMGLDTKIFSASGDGGVDCVAYDPTPVFGGKYVIQAKLYTKTVPPTAVRDLFGTMQHEGATKGILVTTSGFGPSSYEFANGKPIQLIDGSGLLALCQQYEIPARIIPGPRRPTP